MTSRPTDENGNDDGHGRDREGIDQGYDDGRDDVTHTAFTHQKQMAMIMRVGVKTMAAKVLMIIMIIM